MFLLPGDATPRKKGRPKKATTTGLDRYPALICNESIAPDEERSACEALRREMQNERPRRELFLPLMKSTFVLRRQYILHYAGSVRDILQDYPALKEACAVSG